ncbi:cystatin-B-like isoform X3 [Bolinopsis microptera]
MKCGGTSDAKPANDEIRAIVTQVKGAVEDHAKKSYSVFEPHSYTTQVVAGTNYFVKVKTAAHGEFVHLRIFEHLPCYGGGVYLHGVLQHHEVGDSAVDYFDQNMNFDEPQWD